MEPLASSDLQLQHTTTSIFTEEHSRTHRPQRESRKTGGKKHGHAVRLQHAALQGGHQRRWPRLFLIANALEDRGSAPQAGPQEASAMLKEDAPLENALVPLARTTINHPAEHLSAETRNVMQNAASPGRQAVHWPHDCSCPSATATGLQPCCSLHSSSAIQGSGRGRPDHWLIT
jgi:hypothetical protein